MNLGQFEKCYIHYGAVCAKLLEPITNSTSYEVGNAALAVAKGDGLIEVSWSPGTH